MKKEKRELTLEQLEKEQRVLKKLNNVLVLLFCNVILIIFLKSKENENIGIVLSISGVIILAVMIYTNLNFIEKIKNQIILKQKQMKLKVLKQLAKEHEGCIKDFVSLKDKNVITDVLSNNIVRITIDFIQDNNFVTTIQYADDTFRSGIRIPAKEFVSILDENSKKEIVDDCIKNIRLKNSDEDVQKIIIRSRCYYYDEDISDDELMEMFELKE